MSEFKPGEIVDITIKGAHVVDVRKLNECQLGVVFDCDSGLFPLTIPLGPPDITVERVAPAEWPPQRGDVWRQTGSGMRWFGIARGSNVYLHSDQGDVMDPQQAYEERHELTLVDRVDGQADEYIPCGCDHHGDHAGCYPDCECAS